MKRKSVKKIEHAISQIDAIIKQCKIEEENYRPYLKNLNAEYKSSAKNLIHYLVFRNYHSGELQTFLFKNGFSGLKNAEGHIMANLLASRDHLSKHVNQTTPDIKIPALSIKKSEKLLKRRTEELLGEKSKKRNVRIMVTQPSIAANNADLIENMMKEGMNTLRINCAHDDEETWSAMIQNAKDAMHKLDKEVTISMDLGGPKIRTGTIKSGPKVVHLTPERNALGHVINPAIAVLIKENELFPDEDEHYVPVPEDMINALETDDIIRFYDTRDKTREFKVVAKENKLVYVHSYDSAYLQTGNELFLFKKNISFKIGEIPPLEQYIRLKKDDEIFIYKTKKDGMPAQYDNDGNLISPAFISCTSEEIFQHVKPNEPIVFDDGKIEGEILENNGECLKVKITYAKESGAKLKADKGINFPESKLKLAGLTQKDKKDLAFVVKNADVVNMSFVNSSADVEDLLAELDQYIKGPNLGIILKIETMSGFRNIVKILLSAMQHKPIGVMIARGDLAVECGWENIGLVQKELLRICHAAHIPVVWATQVMENLAKKGLPSRAEITDAVMAQHADCVMLNKGMYITEAISLLDTILINLEKTRNDKRAFFKQIDGIG
ncbi:pyruvate kinase [Pustulibacterium marinum]|uniref:pyruvate kinase n=1 Tax=Pustulibacterium marinum TaxID=1224947 RepID=A0A1I7FAH5_9FLAO|nr:pyruvate kinase [Pustulibacterium marinum]SFU33182.1 pyruvate kinase [Pustulibacterium marinum]